MRIGFIVASNKFTGAAAVADHWCRSLHAAGVRARMQYVGGANLERRLGADEWAAPVLSKVRRPSDLRSNLAALKQLAADSDAVISFLPHDHAEAVLAGIHRTIPLVRAFRRPRHLRRDPLHRWLATRLRAAFAVSTDFEENTRRLVRGRPVAVIPVPVDDRFQPGPNPAEARRSLGLPPDRPAIGMVGKMAAARGWESLLETAAHTERPCTVVAVGHGEHQPVLERLAADLGLTERMVWAGKRERDLPAWIGAMDASVFAAPGSDWGHRAVSEAQACGRPVLALRLPGLADLIRDGVDGEVGSNPEELARAFDRVIGDGPRWLAMSDNASRAAAERRFEPIGRRLREFLEGLVVNLGCKET